MGEGMRIAVMPFPIMKEKEFEVRDMRHKEKFQIDDAYLNGYARKVGVYGTAVYMSLCRHADKNQQSYPSLKKLAEQHNCSRSQIIRAIKLLEKENIIKKVRMGKKLNNRYLLLDKSEWSNRNFTGSTQELHLVSGRNFHSKDTHIRNTHKKGNYKMYWHGLPIIEDYGKLYAIENGIKVLFTGKESEIEYK